MKIAQVWLRWILFDIAICKFELAQWLAACYANIERYMEGIETENELE